MAAPKFAPVGPTVRTRAYESPDHVPDPWVADRPGDIDGLQPRGPRLGTPGPDQGYALKLANRLVPELHLQPGERTDDAVRGCLGIALARASMFGRAPLIHDLTIAFTMWGYFDPNPPAELVEERRDRFAGVGDVVHGYDASRALVDMVPDDVLRSTPQDVAARYPAEWRALTGA